jgi:hypothetical protein
MGSNHLPEGYTEFCSVAALESLALSRMNQAAMLRTEAKRVLRQLVQAEAEVRIVCWMLEKRRSREFRSGYETQARPTVRSAALPNAKLCGLAEFSADNCESSMGSISARLGLWTGPSGRNIIEQIRMRQSAAPIRALGRRRTSLSVRVRDTHPARKYRCEAASRVQPEQQLSRAVSAGIGVEPDLGQTAAVLHPAPAWQLSQGGTTKRDAQPERREKKHLVPVRILSRVRVFEARAPSGPSALHVPSLSRRTIHAHAPLVVLTSSPTKGQPVRVFFECPLASAS